MLRFWEVYNLIRGIIFWNETKRYVQLRMIEELQLLQIIAQFISYFYFKIKKKIPINPKIIKAQKLEEKGTRLFVLVRHLAPSKILDLESAGQSVSTTRKIFIERHRANDKQGNGNWRGNRRSRCTFERRGGSKDTFCKLFPLDAVPTVS